MPLFPVSSGTAGTLGNQRESMFRSQIGRKVQNRIDTYNTYRLYTWNIMPFGHHLCAYQNIVFPVSEIIQNIPGAVLIPGAVQVKSGNACLGNQSAQIFYQLLRSASTVQDFL